jgi:hypothetical protein
MAGVVSLKWRELVSTPKSYAKSVVCARSLPCIIRSNQHRTLRAGACSRKAAGSRALLILFESGGFPNRFRSDSRCMLGWRPACMGRAYSLDLRKRVVAAVVRGKSRRAAAALFDVSVASVVKWTQRAYETGRRPGRRAANGPIFWRASATGCWLVSTRSPI